MALRWSTVSPSEFTNGWRNYNTATSTNFYSVAQYTRDDEGIVTLRGLIAPGSANTEAFRLPEGFRPFIPYLLLPTVGSRTTTGYPEPVVVRVGSDGGVLAAWNAANSLMSVCLETLSFSIAPTIQ